LFQNAGLDSRFRFLLFDGLPRDPQQLQLQTASYRQKQAEKPRPPLINVFQNRLLFVVYRDGRDAREGYAVLGLLGAYFGCSLGIYWGLCRIDDGHRRTGHMILALAIAVGLAAAITGASGCLPWQWWHCAYQHSEYRPHFQHDSTIVPHKYLDRI
jgi:hypothetical protein